MNAINQHKGNILTSYIQMTPILNGRMARPQESPSPEQLGGCASSVSSHLC